MPVGQLQRRLGLFSAISITAGGVIGSGIFLKPLIVAQSLPGTGWIYLLWIGLGVVSLFGAFAYAELGALFPEAGGQYAFLREGWGRMVAYLYGWTFYWVINSGTLAALALAFADNLLPLLGADMQQESIAPRLKLVVAAVVVVVLATINHFGVVAGAVLQNLSALAKVGALALIVAGGLWYAAPDSSAVPVVAAAVPPLQLSGLVTAFIGIFWAYEGWYTLPFNAAELRRPERHLPLGLIVGMVLVIAVYTAVNAIYLRVVPFAEMRTLTEGGQVPALTVARVCSPQLAHYLTLLIAVSVMGAANTNFLSCPRAFYAMGRDRLVPQALTRVHARWGTPTVAIWSQAAWAVLLIVGFRGFHDVTDFVVFASFIFYALTVAAVYRLRRRRPELPRPYRCGLYPWSPALFIAVAIAFVVAQLTDADKQRNALIGLGILATGAIAYLVQQRRQLPPAAT